MSFRKQSQKILQNFTYISHDTYFEYKRPNAADLAAQEHPLNEATFLIQEE